MNKQKQETRGAFSLLEATPEEWASLKQDNDIYILQQAKELLCELWKANRITAEARFMGENILAAALHAIENPSLTKLGTTQGAKLAQHQWAREQERANEPF